MSLLNLIKCSVFCTWNVYNSDLLAVSLDYVLCFCLFFIWWQIKVCRIIELLSLPKWMVLLSIHRCSACVYLMFPPAIPEMLLFSDSLCICHRHFRYLHSVNKSSLLPMQCQSKSPIWGAVWEKGTLFRWRVCKPGKHSPQETRSALTTLRQRGSSLT